MATSATGVWRPRAALLFRSLRPPRSVEFIDQTHIVLPVELKAATSNVVHLHEQILQLLATKTRH